MATEDRSSPSIVRCRSVGGTRYPAPGATGTSAPSTRPWEISHEMSTEAVIASQTSENERWSSRNGVAVTPSARAEPENAPSAVSTVVQDWAMAWCDSSTMIRDGSGNTSRVFTDARVCTLVARMSARRHLRTVALRLADPAGPGEPITSSTRKSGAARRKCPAACSTSSRRCVSRTTGPDSRWWTRWRRATSPNTTDLPPPVAMEMAIRFSPASHPWKIDSTRRSWYGRKIGRAASLSGAVRWSSARDWKSSGLIAGSSTTRTASGAGPRCGGRTPSSRSAGDRTSCPRHRRARASR